MALPPFPPPPEAAAQAFRAGELSIEGLLDAYLARIAELNPMLCAFIEVFEATARVEAKVLAAEAAAGHWRSPLHGMPVAIKDIIDVAGSITTCHSRLRAAAPPAQHDAPIIARLRAAGAIIIGKTALHEFATGGPSFDLPWPPARNPWNSAFHPGGSSSGSGVAVAAGMVGLALGTDTAGSVRHPASACGIVGLKPTFGTLDCAGAYPLSPTLDHVGILAPRAVDAAIALDVLQTDTDRPHRSAVAALAAPIAGLRIGVIEGWDSHAAAEIRAALLAACDSLSGLGAELRQVQLPRLADFTECGRLILQAEAFALHRTDLASRGKDYGARGRARLSAGQGILAADYLQALDRRRRLTAILDDTMAGLDALITVSSLQQPCRIDDEAAIAATYDRQARTPFNVTGVPAVAVPIALCPQGLPIAVQIIGHAYDEATILRLAAALQRAHPMPMPPLPAGQICPE